MLVGYRSGAHGFDLVSGTRYIIVVVVLVHGGHACMALVQFMIYTELGLISPAIRTALLGIPTLNEALVNVSCELELACVLFAAVSSCSALRLTGLVT